MANKKIKGITVEIGGDTTKLGEALKDSESKSKSLQDELKEVATALKFNPDNVELLTQKQKLLADQVGETAKKLDVLRSAEKQVASQFESGEIGEEQYRAFQREIVTTESKLKNYEGQLEKTENSLRSLGDETNKVEKSTDDLEKELKEAESTLNDTKDAVGDLAEGLGLIGGAMVAGATGAVTSATTLESSLNSLQAQTGKTDVEMIEFEESLERLYKGNYGESMEALADSMAKVAQYTGETDPVVIEDMTRNLITLEDTFGMDFNETLRGVNGLMKNMGLTADEAFDYIAKGAQNGLNKSDELGDNLAEYTQLWGQAGFTAEEMFSILDNGLDNGAYNLDKVNDFVKEFTISLSDGRIEENISSFSKDTQKLFKEWKKGKATSSQVFKSVVKDLKNTEDQQEALTTASTVWSSLGEDNALKIIASLDDVNDTFENVSGTMKDVNKIKYDDLGNRLETLGRTVVTDVITPIGEDLIPLAEKFIEYASENIDDLIPLVKTLGVAFATIFVINKVSKFIDSIGNLKTAFQALNTVMKNNPIGWVGTAIGVAVGATLALNEATNQQIEKTYGLTDAEEKLIEKIDARAQSMRDADEARKKSNANIETEIGHCQNLWAELKTIVDKNGEIKQGYEDRATVVTGMLAESLGIEIDIVDGQIQKYEELKQSIEDVIRTKRAEALLDVNKEAYTTALGEQKDAFAEYNDMIKQVADSEKALNEAQEKLNDAWEAMEFATTEEEIVAANVMIANAQKGVDKATEAHKKNKEALEKSQETYLGYCNTIEQYDGLMEALASGDVNQLTVAMDNLSYGFLTAENATEKMLKNQLKEFKKQYENMKLAVEQGMPGVTQEQVDRMGDLVDRASKELDKLPSKAKKSGEKTGDKLSEGVSSKTEKTKSAGKQVANAVNLGMGTADTKTTGSGMASKYISGVSSKLGGAKTAGKSVSKSTATGLGSADTRSVGIKLLSNFTSGVNSKQSSAKTSGKKVATAAKTGLSSVKTESVGENFVAGFGTGANRKLPSIKTIATNLGKSALGAIERALGIASPSKEAGYLGEFFTLGFANGMNKKGGVAVKQAESIADDALKALNKVDEVEFTDLFSGSDTSYIGQMLQHKTNTVESKSATSEIGSLLTKLDNIYERLNRAQIILDSGVLVGEMLEKIDAGLADRQALSARGV